MIDTSYHPTKTRGTDSAFRGPGDQPASCSRRPVVLCPWRCRERVKVAPKGSPKKSQLPRLLCWIDVRGPLLKARGIQNTCRGTGDRSAHVTGRFYAAAVPPCCALGDAQRGSKWPPKGQGTRQSACRLPRPQRISQLQRRQRNARRRREEQPLIALASKHTNLIDHKCACLPITAKYCLYGKLD